MAPTHAVIETPDTESPSTVSNLSEKARLLARVKERVEAAEADIEAGQASIQAGKLKMREAAEDLFIATDKFGATQREAAKAIGKSPAWVNRLLKWREDRYQGDTPFGPASKAARGRRKRVQSPEQQAPSKNPVDSTAAATDTLAENTPLNLVMNTATKNSVAKRMLLDSTTNTAAERGGHNDRGAKTGDGNGGATGTDIGGSLAAKELYRYAEAVTNCAEATEAIANFAEEHLYDIREAKNIVKRLEYSNPAIDLSKITDRLSQMEERTEGFRANRA